MTIVDTSLMALERMAGGGDTECLRYVSLGSRAKINPLG